ncbi:MAG: methionyl-tRNA formyltransferase [Pseudomonadota bacterium]
MVETHSYNIIFLGSPTFAATSLNALIQAQFNIQLVLTQPDKPTGRGRHLKATPVKQLAQAHKIDVLTPTTLKDETLIDQLAALQPDFIVVAAYGLIIPKEILAVPAYGCINVHASLLPRWRGAAPIQSAILAGDKVTGVSMMQVVPALDAGPYYAQRHINITPTLTASGLHDELAHLGADLLIATLPKIYSGEVKPEQQDASCVTYANKITKAQARIDWQKSAVELDRQIRAYHGWPVAFSQLDDLLVRIWQAKPLDEKASALPGTIIKASKADLIVATGEGELQIEVMQLPGGKALPAKEVIKSKHLLFQPGKRFV